MVKYSDDEIRNMKKITCKIAGDYLGIGPMAVSIGSEMICCQLVLRFINEDRYADGWSYNIIAER